MEDPMKKTIKLLLFVLICSALIFTCLACKKDGENLDQNLDDLQTQGENEAFKTEEEVKSSLTNYSFKYLYSYTQGETTTTIQYTDKRAGNVWLYGIDNDFYLSDMDNSLLYTLDGDDLTGSIITSNSAEPFSTFDMFDWYQYADSFAKVRTATVAGRTCNVYSYSISALLSYEYYIDTELDICLKYTGTTNENSFSFYFTEFALGNTTAEALLSVKDGYTLDDYRNIG